VLKDFNANLFCLKILAPIAIVLSYRGIHHESEPWYSESFLPKGVKLDPFHCMNTLEGLV
jgi:hypothetical protein